MKDPEILSVAFAIIILCLALGFTAHQLIVKSMNRSHSLVNSETTTKRAEQQQHLKDNKRQLEDFRREYKQQMRDFKQR